MLVRPGFEPTASRSADRRSPNWANRAAALYCTMICLRDRQTGIFPVRKAQCPKQPLFNQVYTVTEYNWWIVEKYSKLGCVLRVRNKSIWSWFLVRIRTRRFRFLRSWDTLLWRQRMWLFTSFKRWYKRRPTVWLKNRPWLAMHDCFVKLTRLTANDLNLGVNS